MTEEALFRGELARLGVVLLSEAIGGDATVIEFATTYDPAKAPVDEVIADLANDVAKGAADARVYIEFFTASARSVEAHVHMRRRKK